MTALARSRAAHPGPKVSVYVAARDYGHWLPVCLASLERQSLDAWEAILVDDGSRDDTPAIMESFRIRHPERVRVLRHDAPFGLRACANAALELARGEYVMRLDADDWLDENALLVLAHHLDTHPDIGLVYPNWIWVDAEGQALGVERRARPGSESSIPDLPAHGACTMVRRRVLKAIGGYDLDIPAQDGHELWLKTLYRHGVAHVETPLFFYRQHGDSLSGDESRLLASRREVKRRAARAHRGPVEPRIAVIVPVKNSYPEAPNLALAPLAGRSLLDYTLDGVAVDPRVGAVLVATDDPAVVAHCNARGVDAYLRDAALSDPMVGLPEVIGDALAHLEDRTGFDPDIVVILSAHTPLRRPEHVAEAIDTLLLYPVDHVLSTWEDRDLHYRHGNDGLEAVNAGEIRATRPEREALYACNGSIHVLWREALAPERFLRGRIGHVVMTRTESLMAKKAHERCLLDLLLTGEGAVTR
jgi:glycosyltransferase involved in cell wall biosynthesis